MVTAMNSTNDQQIQIWEVSPLIWAGLAITALFMGIVYYDGLELMVSWWATREEYGHGFIIPFITAFLVWQKKDQLETLPFTGSWAGSFIVLVAVGIYALGELGSLYTVIQYSFLIALFGVVLSLMGTRSFRVILVPFLILVFMLPLPNYMFNNLSSQLQLISSEIGVAVIRLFDISVYLEGNVIDLGSYKLQVVEACSGLNYLFPLMTLGFIAAYFFTGAFWKKAIIFLSTIPITVFMNSFRIGIIGITVEYWGKEMAEGFLHDFEGWVVFMSCTGILILEMWILANIGSNKLPLRQAFGVDFPDPSPEGAEVKRRHFPRAFIVSIIILLISLPISHDMEKREEIKPDRKPYAEFPLKIGEWHGRDEYLEQIYIDKLKLSDYALLNYTGPHRLPVNFYSAYYSSQRKGSTTHSPRACIPGGGWQILSMTTINVPGVSISSVPLAVNRLLIEKNGVKQLVYYWFQQRGRIITHEVMVKWYFFVDALKKSRSDGALMRLTTLVPRDGSIDEADKRLTEFVGEISGIIPEYVPN